MNVFSVCFLLINSVALLALPRRLAPLPLLVGACYMTLGQLVQVGPLHFTVIRILIAAGVARVVFRRERFAGKMVRMDILMVGWTVWALLSSMFHTDSSSAFVYRLGLAYNACGIYFLLRVFCHSLDDVIGLCRITALLLVPVAIEMLVEKVTVHNHFAVLGGVSAIPAIRAGEVRAQGPFAHAILAGTVGAVCLPLMIGLYGIRRRYCITGVAACLTMVAASASSGPLMSAMASIGALLMWRGRLHMRVVRWLAVLGYIGLDLVMKAPAYYLLGRIDLTGGSTGWHRARLIESSIEHLNEWWLAGTDHTRHWMPTGVPWSEAHTDITNHYLGLGVLGGLPLMFLFIAILAQGFALVGQTLRRNAGLTPASRFVVWSLGASLFAHAATCISVSYFDQSVVFLYMTLAAIGSAHAAVTASQPAPGWSDPVSLSPSGVEKCLCAT